MKREKAKAAYDSDSTETDEETIDIQASGASNVRVKREMPVTTGTVPIPCPPRQPAPIPATSVLGLGHNQPQTSLSAAPRSATTERPFSNSILDLMVDLPAFSAPMEVPRPNTYHRELPAQPRYQEPPPRASLSPKEARQTGNPERQQPPRLVVQSPTHQQTPSRVVHASPFQRAPRAAVTGAPQASAESRTVSKSYQAIAHGYLVDSSPSDIWDAQVATQGNRCGQCETELPPDEKRTHAKQANCVRCMCCKRVLPRLEKYYARKQLAKPADMARCRWCSKDVPRPLEQSGYDQLTEYEVAACCGMCEQKFGECDAATAVDTTRKGVRCGCCQRKLTKSSFSKKQRAQASTRRCKACVGTKAQVGKTLKPRIPGQASAALGNAEQQQQAELTHQHQPAPMEGEPVTELASLDEDRKQMEIALTDFLRRHESITRRRATNNLEGSYREAFELELLDEEEKLHMHAAAMRLDNEALYDDVCGKIDLVEGGGASQDGGRQHNTGQLTLKRQKKTRRGPRRKKRCHPFLDAAKATAIRQRAEWMQQRVAPCGGIDEPARKRAKRGDHESPNGPSFCTEARQLPPHLAALATELQRKETKTTHEVIEINDSD